jgi:hypothetical protein
MAGILTLEWSSGYKSRKGKRKEIKAVTSKKVVVIK